MRLRKKDMWKFTKKKRESLKGVYIRAGVYLSPWLFNVHIDAVIKEVKMGMGRKGENGDCLASRMQMASLYVGSRRKA